ncbi:MAG: protein translocase subunit SecF [candidate division Zixibacteria bacterium]|nr:protein translocase subunit SecF [candidate division Zixibacteria bacterium]
MLQILKKTNIDFIGKRYYAFAISGILVIFGLAAFVAIFLGKADLGIDFAGGTMLQGYFEKEVKIGELRAALSRNGYDDAFIQSLHREHPNYFLIRVKATTDEDVTQTSSDILSVLAKEFPQSKFNMDSVDGIGPAVGKTLQRQARWAVLLALAGILLYIWIRFDFRFGVAATITTLHDVLLVLGILFMLQKDITLLVVTALLTLAGYSLNDTVVLFDRIRENLKLFRKRGNFPSTINASINEVLSRTIITSLTTFAVVFTLFLVGGEVVHDFSLALMIGIVVGTYSSMFVASPIIMEWERKSPKRFK